jgi:hypothetical protein
MAAASMILVSDAERIGMVLSRNCRGKLCKDLANRFPVRILQFRKLESTDVCAHDMGSRAGCSVLGAPG